MCPVLKGVQECMQSCAVESFKALAEVPLLCLWRPPLPGATQGSGQMAQSGQSPIFTNTKARAPQHCLVLLVALLLK